MKIKIVGDGTLAYTEVINAETGERLENIKAVTWTLDADSDKRLATATITLYNVPIEMDMEAEVGG